MPTYQNKIAIIIRADLLEWQKLNVAAFLASSVAVKFPEPHGRPFVTASWTEYLPFPKNPMLIYRAENDEQIRPMSPGQPDGLADHGDEGRTAERELERNQSELPESN